jgi:hypothetical protein
LAVFNSAPIYDSSDSSGDFGGGGIWQAGAAITADSAGNIYVTGANGSATALNGGIDYGEAALKMQFIGSTLSVLDSQR